MPPSSSSPRRKPVSRAKSGKSKPNSPKNVAAEAQQEGEERMDVDRNVEGGTSPLTDAPTTTKENTAEAEARSKPSMEDVTNEDGVTAEKEREGVTKEDVKMETGVATKSEEVGKEGDDEETCPLCTPHAKPLRKEDWVMCEACNTWYHWRCAGDGEDVKRVEKWYCKQCLEQDSTRSITYKAPARKSLRKRPVQDYASLDGGANTDPKRFLKQLENKRLKPSPFRKMKGEEVNLEWLEDESAMTEPVVIEVPEGLGMKMPESEWSADDIASELGEGMPVEVMDCATQSNSPGWTLGRWADYMEASPSDRLKSGKWGKGGVYNVISLEVSGTKVGEMVLPPKIVRDLDWVEKFWPSTRKGRGHVYPKVQLYSLMGVEGAWTDWHIDFAGSSVYYHILSGSKVSLVFSTLFASLHPDGHHDTDVAPVHTGILLCPTNASELGCIPTVVGERAAEPDLVGGYGGCGV
jgi:hypothetical protein